MDDSDIDKPLSEDTLSDPHSPEVQLILNLYSMEPPFYADVNNASRSLDKSKLQTLGPFAMAIFKILLCGFFSDKKREDALERGIQFSKSHELGSMCRSFLLFRGALMNKEWITGWREEIGKSS